MGFMVMTIFEGCGSAASNGTPSAEAGAKMMEYNKSLRRLHRLRPSTDLWRQSRDPDQAIQALMWRCGLSERCAFDSGGAFVPMIELQS